MNGSQLEILESWYTFSDRLCIRKVINGCTSINSTFPSWVRNGIPWKFGHTLRIIQHISPMSIIDLCYSTCRLAIQTVATTLPAFQGIKRCVQYMASHPHKTIFYPSNSYDGSNFISITWSVNQVEYHTTHNCLGCNQ